MELAFSVVIPLNSNSACVLWAELKALFTTVFLLSALSLKNKESIKKMELIIEEELNKEFGDILEEFRKLNTDPIGIGRKIKSIRKYSNLNEKDLRGKYSTLNLKPNIKVEIKRTGAVD